MIFLQDFFRFKLLVENVFKIWLKWDCANGSAFNWQVDTQNKNCVDFFDCDVNGVIERWGFSDIHRHQDWHESSTCDHSCQWYRSGMQSWLLVNKEMCMCIVVENSENVQWRKPWIKDWDREKKCEREWCKRWEAENAEMLLSLTHARAVKSGWICNGAFTKRAKQNDRDDVEATTFVVAPFLQQLS